MKKYEAALSAGRSPWQPVEKCPQVVHASIEFLGENAASFAGKDDFFNRLLAKELAEVVHAQPGHSRMSEPW